MKQMIIFATENTEIHGKILNDAHKNIEIDSLLFLDFFRAFQ